MKYFIFLVLFSGSVFAQNCADIEDKLARLDCYDSKDKNNEVDPFILELRKPMVELLKNPDSAQFRDEVIYRNDILEANVLCGELNAHNSWGAYTGFSPFITFKSKAYSIDATNRTLVKLLCKDTLISDFPGAVVKNEDSYIELARTMVSLNIDLGFLSVYKDEFLKPLGDYNAACGLINYPYLKSGYTGYKRYLMAGVGAIRDRGGDSGSKSFDDVYELFCGENSKHMETYNGWYLINRGSSPNIVTVQDNSALVLSCVDGEPVLDLYTEKGIFLNKEEIENDSVDEKYRAETVDPTSMSINIQKRSGKSFLKDFSVNKETVLKINYTDKITFDTKGFASSIDEFKLNCPEYNWKKNWDNR